MSEGTSSVKFDELKGSENYHSWKFSMTRLLQTLDLDGAIDGSEKDGKKCKMYDLTKIESKFKWNEEAEKAFNELKLKLKFENTPILTHPDNDPNNPFILTTDACEKGYGAVLSQMQNGIERPIGFWSQKAIAYKKSKAAHDHEFNALKKAIYEFRYYLNGGKKFIVYTDNQMQELISITVPI